MTWFPLQAALKMSTLPGAIRATLDALLGPHQPRPRGPHAPRHPHRVGEPRAVGGGHRLFRGHHQGPPAAPARRERPAQRAAGHGAEAHRRRRVAPGRRATNSCRRRWMRWSIPRGSKPSRPVHPRHASLSALAAVARVPDGPAEVGVRHLPQAPADGSLGENSLPQAETVGASSFPQLGQAPSPELPQVDLYKEELTTAPTILVQSQARPRTDSPATAPPLPEWRTTD